MDKIFLKSIDVDRFSIAPAFNATIAAEKYKGRIQSVRDVFTPRQTKHLISSLIRFAFFIEPVKKPKIETTKFNVRWSPELDQDPRQASFEVCDGIFAKLLSQLVEQIAVAENRTLLAMIIDNNLISYELNVDYVSRISNNPIHTVANTSFFWSDAMRQAYTLREFLLGPLNTYHAEFFRETYKKVAVKSFLTDRVLTGTHKTNREKRWECHPESVHFSLRAECLQIEAKLIKQICHFRGFPVELRTLMTEHSALVFDNSVTRCPITLEPLDFDLFEDEVVDPIHGKSSFQVGHLHPLKSIEENLVRGHTADNISWISSQGNRIQGDLSSEEVRAMMIRIFANYRSEGIVN